MNAAATTMRRMARPTKEPTDNTFRSRFARRLRVLRLEANLDVEQASKAITKAGYKIGVQGIYKIESGRQAVLSDALPAIAKAYKTPLRDVLPPR